MTGPLHISALSNAANIVLAALLLDPDRGGGAMMLAVTVAYVVVSVNRAFIGDVLLAQASRHDGDHRTGWCVTVRLPR